MKTETQHTPGPWTVIGQITGSPDYDIRLVPNNDWSHDKRPSVRVKGDNAQANAALIAQAPTLLAQRDELLEALVDAITELEQLAEAAGRLAEFGSFIDRQHAAIAKAGGKDGGK